MRRRAALVLAGVLVAACGAPSVPDAASERAAPIGDDRRSAREWATLLGLEYRVLADVLYHEPQGHGVRLDLYVPVDRPGPHPTVVHFHGGGWIRGTRSGELARLLPWLEMGVAVVNVSYRLGPAAPAPAAVDDARCALRWVGHHAGEYGLDPARVVLTGVSAGGHLALAAAFVPASVEIDRSCAWSGDPEAAAVVNWFGITDVADLLGGPDRAPFPAHWPYAEQWLAGVPNRRHVASWVSPVTHVRPGRPPVLTVHGDEDPLVPYRHATLLHRLLDGAGIPNELVTVPGGAHGGFDRDTTLRIHDAIRSFLARHGAIESASVPARIGAK